METTRRALVIGATGLIGKNVITRLLESDKLYEPIFTPATASNAALAPRDNIPNL